ncbi:MAG TPA: hypothetical protein VFN85_08045 [Solirubrobacterales bacterium]|nr:hypothetical protein [Solirubrobacterales bacterium]
MSRIRIFALFATVAVLAGVLAACGGGGSDSSNEDPQKVIERASLEGVKSGEFDLSLSVNAEGEEGGELEASLSGPFEAGAKGELPQAEVSVDAKGNAQGENIAFEGGLTLLTDRAFVEYEGTSYEVDPTTFGFLKSAVEQAQQQEGSEADVTACQKAAEGIKFSQFADNLENEGSEDIDGTSTTKVSGDLNVGGAIDALIQLTEDPACSSQLEAAGPLPIGKLEEAKGELSKAIKKSHVEIAVGDDDIVRKFAMELTVEPPEAKGEKVELEMELTLSGVNEEQSFQEPSNAKPLEGLFKRLGVNPLELLQGASSGEGLGGLLEGLMGGSAGSGPSQGGSSFGSSETGSSGNQKAYVQCLQKAQTPADLQKCARLLE